MNDVYTPLDSVSAADRVAVRRGRTARRVGVMAVIAFTVALWFAENYLRYERSETQFIMSLTLQQESARPILRDVVNDHAKEGKEVNAAYIEELASIEEEGFVLTRYQEAYARNPSSWSLVLNYGTRLFLEGQYVEARERFREAGVQDPENALPRYLEAATLAISSEQESDLGEALAIIARTNISGSPVRFPEPVWHSSLPRRGDWYQDKQAEIVDRCCAPLYRFKNVMEARARTEAVDNAYEWGDWLEAVAAMGERLASGGAPQLHMGQVVAGIQLQLDVISLETWLAGQTGKEPAPEWAEREKALRAQLDALNVAEQERNDKVQQMKALLWQPLGRLSETGALLALGIVFMTLLGRLLGARQFGREFAPPPWALAIPVVLGIVFLGILTAYPTAVWPVGNMSLALVLGLAWYLVAGVGILLGVLLPLRFLPSAERIAQGALPAKKPPAPWKLRLGTWLNLVQRLWEDQFAALVFAGCVWFLLSRALLGVYPIQLALLLPGFEESTQQLLRAAASVVGAVGN